MKIQKTTDNAKSALVVSAGVTSGAVLGAALVVPAVVASPVTALFTKDKFLSFEKGTKTGVAFPGYATKNSGSYAKALGHAVVNALTAPCIGGIAGGLTAHNALGEKRKT